VKLTKESHNTRSKPDRIEWRDSNTVKVLSHCAFNCVSSMVSYLKHLSYSCGHCFSSFEKCLLRSFAHFLKCGCFLFCLSLLYIFYVNSYGKYSSQYFCPTLSVVSSILFPLLFTSFATWRAFISLFCFCSLFLGNHI
jgi:hypothetical protein